MLLFDNYRIIISRSLEVSHVLRSLSSSWLIVEVYADLALALPVLVHVRPGLRLQLDLFPRNALFVILSERRSSL